MKYLIVFMLLFSFSFNLSAKRYKKKTCRTKACKLRKKRKELRKEKLKKEKLRKEKMVHKLISNAKLSVPIDISLKYRNDSDGEILVFLHYATFFDPKWKIVQMELAKDIYQATIPTDYVLKGGVIYYIEVVDEFEDVIDRVKSKKDPQYISVKEISEKKIDKENKKRKIKKRKKEKKKIELMIQEEFALFNQDDLEVVTASKKSQKSVDAPAIIAVISSNMINKMGAITLLDILNYIPGINTKLESNGKLRVSIRGVEKDGNILLMINGSRINNLYDSNALYDLPATFIKRVEIIRGPGSALFGTDAVAGIINIITADNSNEAIYSMGINNNYSLGLNYSAQRYGYKLTLLGGILNSTANQELDKDYFYTKEWDLTYTKPIAIDRKSSTAYLSTSIKSDKFTISFLGLQQKYTDWIGPAFVATTDSLYVDTRAKLETSYQIKFNNITITPKLYGDFLDNDNLMQTRPSGYLSSVSGDIFEDGALTKEKYQIYSVGGDLQVDIDFNKLNIITGATWQYFNVNNYDLKRNYKISGEVYHHNEFDLYDTDSSLEQKNKDRTVMALFLQADYKFNNFAITAGVRGDYYDDIGTDTLIFSSISPRLGIVYRLGDSTIIKALYGEAFRAPTFKELYDQTDKSKQGITGNKNLSPEKVKTSELAFETKIWNIKLKSNIFYNISDNIISPFDIDGSGSVGTYENIGSTKSYGIESELITEFKFINLFVNLSWFSTSFNWNNGIWKFGSPTLTDREKLLTDIPMRKINMGINGKYKKLNIFLGITNVSHSMNNHRMALEDLSTVYIPAYWSFDLNVSYQLTNQLRFSLIGKNIGYSHYTAPGNSNNIDNLGDKGMIQPNFFWMSKLVYQFDFARRK